MADKKISQLPASTTPVAGTEELAIVQSGDTKKVSVENLTAGRVVKSSGFEVDTTGLNGGSIKSSTPILDWVDRDNNAFSSVYFDTTHFYIVSDRGQNAANSTMRLRVDNQPTLELDSVGDVKVETGNLVIGTSGKNVVSPNTPYRDDAVYDAGATAYISDLSGANIQNESLFGQGKFFTNLAGDQTVKCRLVYNRINVFNMGVLRLTAVLRHRNSGSFDILVHEYHFAHKVANVSDLTFPLTPAYTSGATGQSNESLTMTLQNPTQFGETQGSEPYYVEFELVMGSGRTSPLHNVWFDLQMFGTGL